jgi:hypothetical protein
MYRMPTDDCSHTFAVNKNALSLWLTDAAAAAVCVFFVAELC